MDYEHVSQLEEELDDLVDDDDEEGWDHGFQFPPDDERKNDKKLDAFRESCESCDVHERTIKSIKILQDRTTVAEAKGAKIISALAAYASHVVKTVKEHPMVIVTVIAVILGVCISGGLARAEFIEEGGFFGTIFRWLLIAVGVLLVWSLFKAVPTIQEANEYINDCRKSYAEDKKTLKLYTSILEPMEDMMRQNIEHGGVPEEYWDYGGILWNYVYTGRADTRSEAILCLNRDMREIQLEMQLEEMEG